MNNNNNSPILILGLGNILLKDEGIGGIIIKELEKENFPENVELIDGGTFGYELIQYMENKKHIILIDAINCNSNPGTIFKFTNNQIKEKKVSLKYSQHQTSFYDVLRMAEFLPVKIPEITIIAIQIKDISMGTELSHEIEEKIPDLIKEVKKELEYLLQIK